LTDIKSFTVVVNEMNSPPVLTVPPNKAIHGLATLVVTNTATDPDVPADTLTFSLVSAPDGVSLDPNSGVLTWTPSEAQRSTTNLISVRVTDNGSPPLSDTGSFTVVVDERNRAPVLITLPNQTINELSTLVLTNAVADPDIPANSLSFNLVSAPAGMILDSDTGVLTWAPTEAQGPSINVVFLQVTDNGSPPLTDTKSFIVVVNEVNNPPILTVPPNQTITELSTLVLTNTAADSDIPANTLTFNLLSAPDGMILDATSGVLTWTPDESQGPSTNLITVSVTDNGAPALSQTNSFTVFVNELNGAPMLTVPPNQTIDELSTLVVINTAADSDIPTNNIMFFNLVSAPAGMSLDSHTGVLTWTPTETQGPSTNLIVLQVTDSGSPPLTDSKSFTVVVNEVNSPPVLAVPPNKAIHGLATLVVTNTATDPDLPSDTFTFTLVSAPDGVSLDPVSGVLTWTPTEAQLPSTNLITVRVIDNGSPPLADTGSFTVVVNEENNAPVLTVPTNRTIYESTTLVLTNTAVDPDVPANTLTYSLDSGSPAGAEINPTNGVLTWTPSTNQVPSTNILIVRVTDNGVPSLSDAKSFTIVVVARPVIEGIAVSGDTVTITWSAILGFSYRVQFRSDQSDLTWSDLPGDVTASGSTAMKTDLIEAHPQRYYRVLVLP